MDKERILVVDDERMYLLMIKRMLDPHYQTDCVSSGEEALEYLDIFTPDLVLLDLHMPEMDGLEVFRRIREHDASKDIPVIFLTSDSFQETEVEILKAGAMDFIQKPFVAQVAVQRIERILQLHKLQYSLQTEVGRKTEELNRKTEELKVSYRKIEHLSRQIMEAMAMAIEAKDRYTNGHSSRVAEYAREISLRLGQSWKESEAVFYAGLMHDVGKIGIPDNIINKEMNLTEEEFSLIKSHTSVGAGILENISEMPELSQGARWHHERYDGKGYPDGLKGEEIPEIARIIGVADAYDAMTSNRSYRRALPQKVVREEIEKGKGTQFDPLVASKMLEMIDEDRDYRMSES